MRLPTITIAPAINYQGHFQQRWPQLTHPHVRSLAWLLDSPTLLNPLHPQWAHQLAELPVISQKTANWLMELDKNPDPLIHYLARHSHTRLGHYAESLLTFYFFWSGELVAHNVQVRSHTTIGEFDFLLNTPDGSQHWEFACKFYLLVAPEKSLSDYRGPNLTDNLSDKTQKIMDCQLALGQHPAAQRYLPTPLNAARALLKGWLFYASHQTQVLDEIASPHCRGLWCRLSQLNSELNSKLNRLNNYSYVILSRLQWMAPAKVSATEALSFVQLQAQLTRKFLTDSRPVLIAQLTSDDEFLVECERIFVVPDDWNTEAS